MKFGDYDKRQSPLGLKENGDKNRLRNLSDGSVPDRVLLAN